MWLLTREVKKEKKKGFNKEKFKINMTCCLYDNAYVRTIIISVLFVRLLA
jgi:hypothetical protein